MPEITSFPVDKLIQYAGNPRKNDHAVETVAAAIKRFGFRVPVLAKSDGLVVDGHLRLKAAKYLGLEEVPAILCDDLSDTEIRALRISINRMSELAEWDAELLSVELEGLAAEGITMEDVGFPQSDLSELLNESQDESEEDEAYTKKIEAPTYEPSPTKPSVSELFNKEKTELLIAEIHKSNIPEEEKAFLISAAQRHTVFDFGKIADFYAHSQPEVQKLMEASALVIIDFNKAIEQGFVRLTENIRKTYIQDNGDEE